MSRGPGRTMIAIRDALRAAGRPLTFDAIAVATYGTTNVTRRRRGRTRRVAVPNGDVANLRRALGGLIRRGTVVVVGRDAPARRRGTRYALSDVFTGNGKGPANAMSLPSQAPASYRDAVPTLTADDSVSAPRGDMVSAPADGNVTTAISSLNDTMSVVPATSSIVRGKPANDVAPGSGAAEPANGTKDGVADPTPHRVHSGSSESSGSSVRLTPSGGIPASIRGKLPVPARVFAWERGLLSTLVDDLLQNLSHAASENDDPNP